MNNLSGHNQVTGGVRWEPTEPPKAMNELPQINAKPIIVTVPFYRKDGFKRICGAVIMTIGGVMALIPATNLLGQALFAMGSVIEGIGLTHAVIKSQKKEATPQSIWLVIINILIQIIKKFDVKK